MKIGAVLRPSIDADDLSKLVREDFELDSMDKFTPPPVDRSGETNEAEEMKKAEQAQQEFEQQQQKQYDYLDDEKLYEALFVLADTWCPNIDDIEYKEFFTTLTFRLKYQGQQDE